MNSTEQTPALVVRKLSKTYDDGFQALNSVDLTIAQGGFFALLGANGAGKSTMISMISSLFPPTAGSIEIFGVDLLTHPHQAKSLLGVVPQEFNFMQFEKVIDILTVQAGYFGIAHKVALPRAKELLKKLGLFDKADTPARALSGGMKRRLMIARALMHRPKLLILDEPTAGVDIELRRSMWEFMEQINREEGTTIILTTHYLEEAEQLCKRIAILDKGTIRINTDMKSLLASLDKETFIFDLQSPLNDNHTLAFDNVLAYQQTDPSTLEISVQKGSNLNGIFNQLTAQGLAVTSMRNKSNRLEELFITLVNDNGTDTIGESA